MKIEKLDVATRSGTVLNGAIFSSGPAKTVVIAITGVHGNFYSNPFYQNIGETLNRSGIDFIYAQTRDAFGKIEVMNQRTGKIELIGSFNEDFTLAEDDVAAYIDFAAREGYENIILAGHSLGANKVIYYLSKNMDLRVKKFILLSPANVKHLTSVVSDAERSLVLEYVKNGQGTQMLPFPLLGWLPCIANTAYQWLFTDILDNVHVEFEKDFSQVEKITHTGALVIGTYDRFTYGDPTAFLSNINLHMSHSEKNEMIFIQNTGHTYQNKEQELAESISALVQRWQTENTPEEVQ